MKKGFTLIELLVVVLIIGILSAVALPQYTKAVERARVSEAKIVLKALANAQNVYMLANDGRATYDLSELDIDVPMDSKYWEFFLNDEIGPGTFALIAMRKGFSYSILYSQGFGPEDGSFWCLATCKDSTKECKKFFGQNLHTQESTNWDLVGV